MSIFSRIFGTAGRRHQEILDRARDRSFTIGEETRRQADAQARQAEREKCDDIRKELEFRRQLDEAELEEELRNTEIPPRSLSEEEYWALSGEWQSVGSSNVAAIQYDHEDERLVIQYHDSSIYAYHPVNMPMAIELYRAPSKGGWVWSNLRVRGSVFGYQVPYELISGPSQRVLGQEARKWMRSAESRKKHGDIPASGRDALGETIKPRHIR